MLDACGVYVGVAIDQMDADCSGKSDIPRVERSGEYSDGVVSQYVRTEEHRCMQHINNDGTGLFQNAEEVFLRRCGRCYSGQEA